MLIMLTFGITRPSIVLTHGITCTVLRPRNLADNLTAEARRRGGTKAAAQATRSPTGKFASRRYRSGT